MISVMKYFQLLVDIDTGFFIPNQSDGEFIPIVSIEEVHLLHNEKRKCCTSGNWVKWSLFFPKCNNNKKKVMYGDISSHKQLPATNND